MPLAGSTYSVIQYSKYWNIVSGRRFFLPNHLPTPAACCFHYSHRNQCSRDRHLQNTGVCLGSQWRVHWANRPCCWRWWFAMCHPCWLFRFEGSGPSLSKTSRERCGKGLINDRRKQQQQNFCTPKCHNNLFVKKCVKFCCSEKRATI